MNPDDVRQYCRIDGVPDVIVSADMLRDQRVPPGQTIVSSVDKTTGKPKWPVLQCGDVPQVASANWKIRLFGLVEEEIELDWARFNALAKCRVRCDMHCVTRWSRLDNVFDGVHIRTILEQTKPQPSATHVMIHAADQADGFWTTNLPLECFTDEDCLFATHHDGQPLTPDHGGPVRLIVPKLYLWKSAKWVTGVEFMDHDEPGFWERNGYHMLGDPWKEQRFSAVN